MTLSSQQSISSTVEVMTTKFDLPASDSSGEGFRSIGSSGKPEARQALTSVLKIISKLER